MARSSYGNCPIGLSDPSHAVFGIYFDVVGPSGTDYRLTDANSQAAWRDVVQNY